MIFRRRRDPQDSSSPDAADAVDADGSSEAPSASAPSRSGGPWDSAEAGDTDADAGYVDLGGLRIKGHPDFELRLSSDPQSGQIAAVMLASPDGAVELRVFAAPRSGSIWNDVRADIAAEVERLGGTIQERDGEYGPELAVELPVTLDDGRQATQPSRIVGVQGPRWLLRATFLGRPAMAPDPNGPLEDALRDVVVVRGTEPMAPREALPLRLPSDARPWSEAPE